MQKLVPQTLLSPITACPRAVGQMVPLCLALWLGLGSAHAATIAVLNNNDAGAGSLRQAIAAAASGDTILFDAALNGQSIVLTSGQLVINKNLTILGLGADQLAISGNHLSRVLTVNAGFTNTIANLTIKEGTTGGDGGGINNVGTLTLNNCTVSDNSVTGASLLRGGGIHNAGILTVNDCTIRSNSVTGNVLLFGGGIHNAGILTVNNCTISGNSVHGTSNLEGGGIHNAGILTVNNSTISSNSVTGNSLSFGGGIHNDATPNNVATLTVNNCTISGNSVNANNTSFGGAINNDAIVTVNNSTISGNSVNGTTTLDGGGIQSDSPSSQLTLNNSTVTGNSVNGSFTGLGGGITARPLNLNNTIVAGNATGIQRDIQGGDLTSNGRNFVGVGFGLAATDKTFANTGTTLADLLETSAGIPVLKNNGGTTFTIALVPGSQAIDAGDPASTLTADQRGFLRPINSRIDIGAFEYGSCSPAVMVLNANDSGAGSLRQAIADVCTDGTITFDNALAGSTIVLTSGELLIDKSLTIVGLGATNLAVSGGGISRIFRTTAGAVITISDLTITGGRGGSPGGTVHGGGIMNQGATVTVNRCVVTGNTSSDNGGAIQNGGEGISQMTIANSAVSGNTAVGKGGGILNQDLLTVINSTVSGNRVTQAGREGGGIYNDDALTLANSTVSGNTATENGGGIYNSGDATLAHSIVEGNTDTSGISPDVGQDFFSFTTYTSQGYNLIGDTNGSSGWVASDLLNTNAHLGPLTNNGGSTLTHALLPGSPAINAGDPAFVPPPDFDQRGDGFPRVIAGRLDIGAFELSAPPSITCPANIFTNVVSASDTAVVNYPAPSVTGSPTPDVNCVPSSGSAFPVGPTIVTCTATNLVGTNTCAFTVSVCAGNIIVANANDSGAGSLRQAIADVCPDGTITFDSTLTGSTIVLTSGELLIDKSVNILGLGANRLAVNGNRASRVFRVDTNIVVTIAGLTITNGAATDGGGIYNDLSTLTVSNCTVAGNSVPGNGGGIYNDGKHTSGSANLTVVNSTLSSNSAGAGGGIYNDGNGVSSEANLTVINSTVSGNSAVGTFGVGGGIDNNGGSDGFASLTVMNSTFSGNSASSGGGIYNRGTGGEATLEIGSTILNAGTSGENIFSRGTETSDGYNLSSDNGSGFLTATGDQTNTPPLLGPLQDNGGPTLTHALLPGSPAINAGRLNLKTPTTDQRGPGFTRIVGGAVDIGAFELQGIHPSIECPADITVTNAPDQCCSTVAFAASASGLPEPTLTYALGGTNITSPYAFSLGTNFVLGTASNSFGVIRCVFTVAVLDPGPECLLVWKFDEASGLTALDSSGNTNLGVLLKGPVRTSGVVGRALRFDGLDDHVNATNPSSLNVTGAFTVACWVKPENVSDAGYLVIKGDSSDKKYAYGIHASSSKIQYRWVSPSGSESVYQTGSKVLNNGVWMHVAVAHTPGSAPTIFINGVAVPGSMSSGSATALIRPSSKAFSVGAASDENDEFKGAIDEVFVCATALRAAQIRNLTNGLPPGPPPPPPVVGIATASPLPDGIAGTGYGASLVATGGTPGFTWSIISGVLPAGLTLNTNTGTISGTLSLGTTNAFRVRVRDSAAQTAEKDFVLSIINPPPCVVHYAFEESSGATAFDTSGSGNHGALINGPSRTTGMVGRALRFDGSNDRVNGSNTPSFNLTSALTLAAWIRPESVVGTRMVIIKGELDDESYSWALGTSDAKLQYRWVNFHGDESVYQTANNVLAVGRWTHIAAVHTPGSAPVLYTNGVLVPSIRLIGSASQAIGVTSKPFTVGSSSDGDDRFVGIIDEVFVCRGASSTADLIDLMAGTPSAPASPSPLPLMLEVVAAPHIRDIVVTGHSAIVSWTAAPGRICRVQYRNNLDETEWQDLTGDIYVENEVMRIEDFLDAQPQRFYRVVSEP